MPRGPLPVGKLDMELLGELLAGIRTDDPTVIVGPDVGRDVAILDTGASEYLVAKTDPITFATDAVGYYAVAVNANDIATCGGTPRWFLATALLPEGRTTPETVSGIFGQIRSACAAIGVTLVGGHSEVTYGLNRPIVVGQMLGTVPRDRYITSAGALEGDTILLTKAIAIEGTSLMAREKRDDLLARGFEARELDCAAGLLYDPGICVLPEAQAAIGVADVHAMHDPTEGGVATGLWELAIASGVGLVIEEAALPVMPLCRRLCDEYGLDPLGLIASGSLLLSVSPGEAAAVIAACAAIGADCAAIGAVTAVGEGLWLRGPDGDRPLPRFDQDEVGRLFA